LASNPEQWTRQVKALIKTDLYYLIRYGCGRKDIEDQWLLDRCREVQADPDGYLDLWAREHYKSTIITFGLTIQDILNDPEVTFGIFSHTRPIAKGFLRQIKREFENNTLLKKLFSEVLWENPEKQAPKWSEDDGLIVKRKSNPKESTLEAHGLVDSMPTSKHFKKMIFDDLVEKKSVGTPDMIKKTTEAWELAQDLGARGGVIRHAGTRYHFNDTYGELMRRGVLIPRIKPATDNGELTGNPVFLTKEELALKRRKQGPYIFACQQMQNPVADESQGFKVEWLKHYGHNLTGDKMFKVLICDPANAKKKTNDYTVMGVIGLAPDRNFYLLDLIRDRLNLTQRAEALFYLHRKWQPPVVAYEKYGKDADISHIEDKMDIEEYSFDITEVGGPMPKNDRVRKLIPIFEQRRFLLPPSLNKTNYEGKTEDLVSVFIEEEYKAFPVSLHDDILDMIARIEDEELKKLLKWPIKNTTSTLNPLPDIQHGGSTMG
jgi:phage terminase large subunit-like protein